MAALEAFLLTFVGVTALAAIITAVLRKRK